MKVLSTRLTKWAEETNLIDESQAGFRQGYSTVDNIFNLQSVIQKYLSKKGGRIYVFYIDFLKAFDNCAHSKLWDSLIRKGINADGKFLRVFRSMYRQLKSRIKIGNYLTDAFCCEKGTKQGCVSSTIVFSLYINDLIDYLKSASDCGVKITGYDEKIPGFLFADDVACVADTVINLQRSINHVASFCDSTGMQININKSKIMVFRNGGPLRANESWTYKGVKLETVPFYKYLGSYFTPKLLWTKTKEILSLQALKAVNSILNQQKHFGYFHHHEAFKLFDSVVKPILTYSAEVWGYQYCEQIENVQIRFCKRIACLNRNVADFFALSECGRYPLFVTYMNRCVKYWCKLTQMPVNRYPKRCYNMLRQLDEAGRTTWATQVKMLLFQYGFGYAWIHGDVGNTVAFLKLFQDRLKDCAKQKILASINSSPKAISYKLYKSNLHPERYLSIPLPYILKKTLSNFRCSSHNLMIEKGRHMKIDRQFRFCQYCQTKNIYVIDDELHFLLVCEKVKQLRHKYFLEEWLHSDPSEALFIRLMSDSSQRGIYALSRFLKSAFELS